MITNYYTMHYHMKQCGVRTVIEDILEALSKEKSYSLNLIYSADKEKFEFEEIKVNQIDIKQVDYDNYIFKGRKKLLKEADHLKEEIKSKLDLSKRCVLHCHNVSIFKNSYLGAALGMLAKDLEDKDFLLLIHHHDFAEENRPNRINLLMNCTGKKDMKFGSKIAYPIGKNIEYMTINSRDKMLLSKIGIPKERITLFPNAVDTDFFTSKPYRTNVLKKRLVEYAKKNDYRFDSKRKILLSPLKVIQRKNIIESLLLLKALNFIKDEWQLLITLEGSSADDVRYGKKIKQYIRKNNLPVTIGFGYDLITANENREKGLNNIVDVFAISNAIITTSIQEGFGFTFLEGWLAGKKVAGRKIPHIFHDIHENGVKMDHFYGKIDVKGKDFKEYDDDTKLKLLDEIDYAMIVMQDELKKTINFIMDDQKKLIENNKKMILRHYSKDSYRRRLKEIISQAEMRKKKLWKEPVIDNKPVIDYFKKLYKK